MDVSSLIANVGAAATGSTISKLLCFPLDTIAVQYQTSTRRPLFSVPLRSYYRGIGVTLLTVTPATAVYLSTREATHNLLLPRLGDGVLNDAVSGCLAELAGSGLFTPMEVLKARMQISALGKEGTLRYQLQTIYSKEGFRGFYRGYFMGLASYIPYNIIWWATYGTINRSLKEKSKGVQIACGAGSAAAVSLAFIHPLELVKTRYQVASSDTVAAVKGKGNSDQKGLQQVAKNVMKEGGIKGFYAGFFPTLLRSVPSAIIMMTIFEHLKVKKESVATDGETDVKADI